LTREKRKRLYVRLLLRTVLLVAVFVLLRFVGPWLISLLAPILIAFIIAMLLNPLVSALHKRLKVPRRLTSILIVLLTLAALFTAVFWIVYGLTSQIISLAGGAQDYLGSMEKSLAMLGEWLNPLLGFLPDVAQDVLTDFTATVLAWIQTALRGAADYILANSVRITTSVGSGVIASIVFVVGTYYMTAEYPQVLEKLRKMVGRPLLNPIRMLKSAITSAFGGYIRAVLLMALIIFVITSIVLALSGQRYALLIGFLIGIVDMLPIIGAVAVLIPWGIVCLLSGEIVKGVFLIILGVAFFLIRRVIEPKIVGSSTGLSPFLALAGISIGMRLAGLLGAIFGPAALVLLISLSREGLLDYTKRDIADAFLDVRDRFWSEDKERSDTDGESSA
jgi:sporulation integral membrane protein YtvI